MKNHSLNIISKGVTVAVFTAVLFLLSISLSPYLAIADENTVRIDTENGSHIIHWEHPDNVAEIDAYIIYINENQVTVDKKFSYFDASHLMADANAYNIFVYAETNGVLSLIGTCSTTVTHTLATVENIIFDGNTLSWNTVENADGYLLFANNIFLGISIDENFDIATKLALSGNFEIIIIPFSENEYLLTPEATHKTVSVTTEVDVPLDVYVFNFSDHIILSWQNIDNISFSYSLTSTNYSIDGELTNTNLSLDSLEDGVYAFTLHGSDGVVNYNFGTTIFTVINGQVHYE